MNTDPTSTDRLAFRSELYDRIRSVRNEAQTTISEIRLDNRKEISAIRSELFAERQTFNRAQLEISLLRGEMNRATVEITRLGNHSTFQWLAIYLLTWVVILMVLVGAKSDDGKGTSPVVVNSPATETGSR